MSDLNDTNIQSQEIFFKENQDIIFPLTTTVDLTWGKYHPNREEIRFKKISLDPLSPEKRTRILKIAIDRVKRIKFKFKKIRRKEWLTRVKIANLEFRLQQLPESRSTTLLRAYFDRISKNFYERWKKNYRSVKGDFSLFVEGVFALKCARKNPLIKMEHNFRQLLKGMRRHNKDIETVNLSLTLFNHCFHDFSRVLVKLNHLSKDPGFFKNQEKNGPVRVYPYEKEIQIFIEDHLTQRVTLSAFQVPCEDEEVLFAPDKLFYRESIEFDFPKFENHDYDYDYSMKYTYTHTYGDSTFF